MGWVHTIGRRLFAALLALLASLLAASPALASPQVCQAWGDLSDDIAALVADDSAWHCGEPVGDLRPERALLRFDLDPAEPVPTHLISRRGYVGAIHLGTLAEDGSLRLQGYITDDQRQADINTYVSLEIPHREGRPRAVIAVFDLPTNNAVMVNSRLATGDPMATPEASRGLMIVALICGMLLMPIVFNMVFYQILRERFLVWHTVNAVVMIGGVLFSSNVIAWLVDIPTSWVSVGSTLGFGLMIGSGTMFARYFIEDDKLHPWLRAGMPWISAYSVALSLLHAAFPLVLRSIQINLYMIAFLPVLFFLFAVMTSALRRGSRAMLYQVVAWIPLLATGVIRQVSYLTPLLVLTDAMTLFYFGCAFEVFATAMGVAERMVRLRQERDRALTEARTMEHLSERDALTGMFNRRVIEQRFDQLRSDGFSTLAILDLDHFKRINDTYGHTAGDEVLRCVSKALSGSEDELAFRMGGEEFVLLLRGSDTLARAEARRKRITAVVARSGVVPELVTASMGLVEAPLATLAETSFEAIYARADQLLYEAKATGRNRGMAEQLKLFRQRRREERRSAA